MKSEPENFIASRKGLLTGLPRKGKKSAEEGGCGVVGFAAGVPVSGRHIFEPSVQMHNRGNGKGGGIAAAGLVPAQLGVDAATLKSHYLLQIALLDPAAEDRVEKEFVLPQFTVADKQRVAVAADFRDLGLDVRPPDVVRYVVRAREEALATFAADRDLPSGQQRDVEDEFVFQNSFKLNRSFYASLGKQQAFVLSHARDLLIFKIVGYAEQVVKYYGLENLQAHVWIAHQRYPTKGRVWHPAGSHPFIGLDEALVHNGDFANYASIADYLRQHHTAPLFLTDTEVSVLLFDLWSRTFKYPVEYVIEALAPTTELDFARLPAEKQEIYRAIQAVHMHGSPDGPWFFIIARSRPDEDRLQLLGITDTSMLRPQVFALQEGDVSIGLIGSEKQAIDAALHSLASEDSRFRLVADRYWNARGGSYTDGGAFIFSVRRNGERAVLSCSDKFGQTVPGSQGDSSLGVDSGRGEAAAVVDEVAPLLRRDVPRCFAKLKECARIHPAGVLKAVVDELLRTAAVDEETFRATLSVLTLLNDRRYDTGPSKRSVVLELVREGIRNLLLQVPGPDDEGPCFARRLDWDSRHACRAPLDGETTLVIQARDFPPEGEEADARLAVQAYEAGWRHFIVFDLRGQRFTGCGFGAGSDDVRMDVHGASGDYLGSGIDGMGMAVHGDGQDQLGQIMKRGTLTVFGDVGQAFMYGAKGGEVYVMGNAAGRPLINAAGNPRVVINGTCLDYLAESFMAGDPHRNGGFVVLNGLAYDDQGECRDLELPYPGGNLFSLASGGAIFVRDPRGQLVDAQLNGGEFAEFEQRDWDLIRPYLEKNEERFGISVERHLLTVDGRRRPPAAVYRKVRAVRLAVLAREEVPE